MHGFVNKAALRLFRPLTPVRLFDDNRTDLLKNCSRFRGSASDAPRPENIHTFRDLACDGSLANSISRQPLPDVGSSKIINKSKKDKPLTSRRSSRTVIFKKSNAKIVYRFRRYSSQPPRTTGDGERTIEPKLATSPIQIPPNTGIDSSIHSSIKATKDIDTRLLEVHRVKSVESQNKVVKPSARRVKVLKVRRAAKHLLNNLAKEHSKNENGNRGFKNNLAESNEKSNQKPYTSEQARPVLEEKFTRSGTILTNGNSKFHHQKLGKNVAIVELFTKPLKFSKSEMVFPDFEKLKLSSLKRLSAPLVSARIGRRKSRRAAKLGEKSEEGVQPIKGNQTKAANVVGEVRNQITDNNAKRSSSSITKTSKPANRLGSNESEISTLVDEIISRTQSSNKPKRNSDINKAMLGIPLSPTKLECKDEKRLNENRLAAAKNVFNYLAENGSANRSAKKSREHKGGVKLDPNKNVIPGLGEQKHEEEEDIKSKWNYGEKPRTDKSRETKVVRRNRRRSSESKPVNHTEVIVHKIPVVRDISKTNDDSVMEFYQQHKFYPSNFNSESDIRKFTGHQSNDARINKSNLGRTCLERQQTNQESFRKHNENFLETNTSGTTSNNENFKFINEFSISEEIMRGDNQMTDNEINLRDSQEESDKGLEYRSKPLSQIQSTLVNRQHSKAASPELTDVNLTSENSSEASPENIFGQYKETTDISSKPQNEPSVISTLGSCTTEMSNSSPSCSASRCQAAEPTCFSCPTSKPSFPPICKRPDCQPPPTGSCSDQPRCPTCKPPFPPICKQSSGNSCQACPPHRPPNSTCCTPTEQKPVGCSTCKPEFPPPCKSTACETFTCPTCKPPFPPTCDSYSPERPRSNSRMRCKYSPRPRAVSSGPSCKPSPKPKTCSVIDDQDIPISPIPVCIDCKPKCKTPFPPKCEQKYGCAAIRKKSKSYTVLDVQDIPASPTPICINCTPKCRPQFPPKCPEKFGCEAVREKLKETKRPIQYWKGPVSSDNANWLRGASQTVSTAYCMAKASMVSAICKALNSLQNKVCKSCTTSTADQKQVQYSQVPFKPPNFRPKNSSNSRRTINDYDYIKSSIPPIKKNLFKKKVRRVTYVNRRLLNDNSKKALVEEMEKRKTDGNATPTLAYSEVLNIVFSQKS